MLDEKQIYEAFIKLKKVLYIEKDENGNIVSNTDKDTLELYKEILQTTIKQGNNQFYHKDSKTWYQKSVESLFDKETNKIHTVEFFEDITKIKERERLLKIDALTTLINDRNESNRMINEYIKDASMRHEEFSIIMADLDSFKEINDTYGHEGGDLVLEKIGKLLSDNTRQSDDKFDYITNDIVTRFGGDEFLILLKNISLEDTKRKIDQIDASIANLCVLYKGSPITVGMSFGYYHVGKNEIESNSDIENLRKKISKKADEYLYLNKNRKKDEFIDINNHVKNKKGMK